MSDLKLMNVCLEKAAKVIKKTTVYECYMLQDTSLDMLNSWHHVV